MLLFDDFQRVDLDGARYAEPMYNYLNRTARPPFARIRQLLKQWAGKYPEMISSEWLGRFRSDDDRHHVGAFFELYCCALLARQGYAIKREPPAEGERETKLEFLVLRGSEPEFLFECTTASGSEFGGAHQKRINRVYDALIRVQSPDFFIGVQVICASGIDPPGRSIGLFVELQLRQLQATAQSDLAGTHGQEALPQWRWEHGGWKIVLFPIAKESEYRGTLDVRPLGVMMSDAKKLNTPKPLLDALREKASKYGKPAIPYVIAIDGMEDCANQESIASALFGGKKWQWNEATRKFHEVRPIDGFWCGPGGPAHQRVSGVLFVPHLEPSRIAENDPVLWHNPWANHPINPHMWLGSPMVQDVVRQKMTLQDGKNAAKLLGLSPSWPDWDDDQEEKP